MRYACTQKTKMLPEILMVRKTWKTSFWYIIVQFLVIAAVFGVAASLYPLRAQVREQSGVAEALVASGRLEDGIVACSACHRGSGEGDAGSGFGNLTGLTKHYLEKQLRDFRSGARENRVMQVVARNLGENDIAALAAYYASLPPQTKSADVPQTPPEGVLLAEEGDPGRTIPACNSCHGSETAREASEIPSLYGQHPIYLTNQLEAWQSGARRNDLGSVMAEIAKKLTPIEMSAVAIYYSRFPRSTR